MTPGFALLPSLEDSLWQTQSRLDPVLMGRIFAPDFFEFGRSGRRYTREELLALPDEVTSIDATLHDLAVLPLSPQLALVTYVSEVRNSDQTEWANRSSIWDMSSGTWQLRFHQGTAIPKGLKP